MAYVGYLRLPRIIVFMLTNALCCVVVALSSWSLADSKDKERLVAKTLPRAKLHISDIVGAGAAVAAASGLSALLCLVLLGYTLFVPKRRETLRSIRVKEGLFITVAVLMFATLVPATLFTAQRSGYITAPGIPAAVIRQLVAASGLSLAYKDQTPVKSFVIVGWVALASTLVSLILVSLAARHAHKHQDALPHHSDHMNNSNVGDQHHTHTNTTQEVASIREDRVSHEKFNKGHL